MEIKIIINTPKATKDGITITVKTTENISSAKEKYYTEAKTRVNNQWCFNGAVLKDSTTISDAEIENMDIIEAHPSSKGGLINRINIF